MRINVPMISALAMVCIVCSLPCRATLRYVGNAGELAAAAKVVNPGDSVILRDGTYTSAQIYFTRGGNETARIIFMAQNPGKAVFNGETGFVISGPYETFRDLYITNGTVFQVKGNIFMIYTHHVNVENVKITDMSNGAIPDSIGTGWVAGNINSYACTVSRCYFDRDSSPGKIIFFALSNNPGGMNHLILGNYFRRAPVTVNNNGDETVRLGSGFKTRKFGDSTSDTTDGYFGNSSVRSNVFSQCNGEAEVISVKSSNNQILYNTFDNCQGMLCLRHYGNTVVSKNFFIGGGDGTTESSTTAVFGGQDDTISYNTFYHCAPTSENGVAILSVGCGDGTGTDALYQQPANILICNNSIYYWKGVGAGIGLTRAYYPQANRTLLPLNTIVSNNIVQDTGSSAKAFDNWRNAAVFFSGNRTYPATGLDTSDTGVVNISVEKYFDAANSMWRPADTSVGVPHSWAAKSLSSDDIAQPWMKDMTAISRVVVRQQDQAPVERLLLKVGGHSALPRYLSPFDESQYFDIVDLRGRYIAKRISLKCLCKERKMILPAGAYFIKR